MGSYVFFFKSYYEEYSSEEKGFKMDILITILTLALKIVLGGLVGLVVIMLGVAFGIMAIPFLLQQNACGCRDDFDWLMESFGKEFIKDLSKYFNNEE